VPKRYAEERKISKTGAGFGGRDQREVGPGKRGCGSQRGEG